MKVKLINKEITSNFIPELLKERGIEDVEKYINPDIFCINSPSNFENIERGYELLYNAIQDNWNILLIVDSDNDGFTSSAIIYQYIKKLNPHINIEYRLHEGKQHGLEDHIDWILEHSNKIDLVIVPDAGSNDYNYIEQLKEIDIP